MKNLIHQSLVNLCLLGLSLGCQGDQVKPIEIQESGPRKFATLPITPIEDVADLDLHATAIRQDLKDLFCVHVYRLPLRSDFTQELSYLCQGNQPTDLFTQIDRYAGLTGTSPKSIKLALEHSEDGTTMATFATAYRVPIEPKWVRSASIFEFMTTDSQYNYLDLEGKVLADYSNDLGGDLQFGKNDLYYHTQVQTPDASFFTNERTTALNSYQVHGGNPSIGIGAEHLLSSPENKYQIYNTITVTIGNEDGGSSLITIIRLSVANNGYPDLTEQVVSDIATAQATHVHNGLRANLQDHFIQP